MTDTNTYSILEDQIPIKIDEEHDPILKTNMQWEKRILHSANMKFFEYGDAYRYYHTPTLPLPLLKLESEALVVNFKPECKEEKIGGYEEIDINHWKKPKNLEHQPRWRLN